VREGKASLTAAAVAFGRGLGVDGSPPDPFAPTLVPGALGAALRSVLGAGSATAPLRAAIRAMSLGMIDHVNLRTAAIDRALVDAVESGIDQLVILGAGLDARAWRMPELTEVDVLEVDHPATQAEKRAHLGTFAPESRSVAFVDVDFERQRLGERLADCDHADGRPTFWIWEGVTPYLQPGAIEATLVDVAARSHAGSVLAMTYAIPELVPGGGPLRSITRLAFRALGEPIRCAMDPADAAARLGAVGFDVVSDTDALEWAALGPGNPTLARPFRAERLALARKR
jgi:methyltransferase (TIGR00027 family)